MELTERICDVITGDMQMEDLYTIESFPVFMGCVEQSKENDIRAELTWQISHNSGLLQLKKLVPLDILYQAQHDAGTVGSIWMEHHSRFASFLYKFKPKSVLEIGGAHGILSVQYNKRMAIP